jgi:hypothetical protein
MQLEAIERAMRADAAKLIGCILTDIRVGTFCADFVFSQTLTITIRIKKKFKFALRGAEELTFDPTLRVHESAFESSNFVFLQGMRCHRTTLDRAKFEIAFAGDARLWVDFGERDFEPLELIGASGERHEKMEFYYVL